ncbi:MAG TPA: Nramp family divalent metal transporter [Candidatus Limnocylindria bacterium]|nr:Nramp family divalent metal transporter [Candidatus Limnocylindria bacterium]
MESSTENLETIEPVHAPDRGWRTSRSSPSLPESYQSVKIPAARAGWLGFLRKLLAFSGPGYLVAVGYMDPGNWATDVAGGSQFQYTLLSVVIISSLMAVFLQHLSLKLGIATGRDLAQACRDHFSPKVNFALWIGCEIAIAACDLAELIGSAIALNLLFGIPLTWGICLTALDVFIVLFLQNKGFRPIEAFVIALIGIIAVCFGIQVFLSKPNLVAVLGGCVPTFDIIRSKEMFYVAIGILGATVMPHNLYLHSSIAQTRKFEPTSAGKREAIFFGTIDSTLALTFALFINAAILIVAGATFYTKGHHEVAELEDAYRLLSPLLGVTVASTLFGVALLAAGQNSTLTGTLAGQIVMEGFLKLRLPPPIRRLITRLVAIVPAVIVSVKYGSGATAKLLVLSQVILSLQLSFAVVPLVMFTSNRAKMGEFVNGPIVKMVGWTLAVVIAGLNATLLYQIATG